MTRSLLLYITPMAAIALAEMDMTCARAEERVIFGLGIDTTGPLSTLDGLVRNGAQIAVDDINSAGGIAGKLKIELQVKDIHPETASTAAQELVSGGARALLTPLDGNLAAAFARAGQQGRVPVIAACESQPEGTSRIGDVAFQIYPSDKLQATALAAFARDQGYMRAFILLSPETAATRQLPLYFADAFRKKGGALVGQATVDAGQTDFGAAIDSIKVIDPPPDVLMSALIEPEFPILMSQLRGAGISTPVLGSDGIDSPTTLALGDVAEGVVFSASGLARPEDDLGKLHERYRSRHGGDASAEPGACAATAYEAVQLVAEAIETAGSTDGAAIREALLDIVGFEGVTGSRITLAGTDRVARRDVAIIRVHEGTKSLVRMQRIDPTDLP